MGTTQNINTLSSYSLPFTVVVQPPGKWQQFEYLQIRHLVVSHQFYFSWKCVLGNSSLSSDISKPISSYRVLEVPFSPLRPRICLLFCLFSVKHHQRCPTRIAHSQGLRFVFPVRPPYKTRKKVSGGKRLHDWQPNRRRQIPWREFNPAGLFVSSAAKWIPFKLKPEDTFSSWPDFTPRTSHIIIIISVVAAFLHFQFSYQKEIPQVFAHPVQPPWNERTPRCPERRVFTSPHLYVMLLFRATEDTASQSTKEQKSLSAFRIHSELIPGAKWFSWMCLDQVWILLKTLTVTHSLTKNTRK